MVKVEDKKRCTWVPEGHALYKAYHDEEWGKPVHDDRILFEFLILEGAQAGLSWQSILERRAGYKRAFANFDPKKVAQYDINKVLELLQDPGIIRNRLKVEGAVVNAQKFLEVQREFGSFDHYLWSFVNHKPIVGDWKNQSDVPAKTAISEKLSKDLQKRGFKFVGPTIIYAYMQAVGLVNDHIHTCFRR